MSNTVPIVAEKGEAFGPGTMKFRAGAEPVDAGRGEGSIGAAFRFGIADAVATVAATDHREERRGSQKGEGEALDRHGDSPGCWAMGLDGEF